MSDNRDYNMSEIPGVVAQLATGVPESMLAGEPTLHAEIDPEHPAWGAGAVRPVCNSFEIACRVCEKPLGVLVQTVAFAGYLHLRCPTCDSDNRLFFTGDGIYRSWYPGEAGGHLNP